MNSHRFSSFIVIPLMLLSLFIPFYGCQGEKGKDNSQISPANSAQSASQSEISLKSDESDTTLAEDWTADLLGPATDEFAKTFQDDSSGEDGKNSEIRDLSVDQALQEEYRNKVTPTFLPKVDPSLAVGGANTEKPEETPHYTLTYHFEPQEVMRWDVTHRINKKVTYAGKTQAIETVSRIVRKWHITEKCDEDSFLCEHSIEKMLLEQRTEGEEPVIYNSEVDTEVPKVFAIFGTDKTVGPVLERFQIDAQGLMTKKEKLVREFHGLESDSKVLVPFPKEPVAVGDSWTIPFTIYLKGRDDTLHACQAVQKFTLDNVQDSLATIRFRAILLTVVNDPVLKGQLAEKIFSGTCRFDCVTGRTLQTELDFNSSVPYAMGDSSHLDYQCHVVETWIREPVSETASEPAATEPAATEPAAEPMAEQPAEQPEVQPSATPTEPPTELPGE